MMRVAVALAALLAATPAMADTPFHIEIPDECALYTEREEDWGNVISVASCMQHVRVTCIDEPGEAQQLVEELASELAPSMLIYVAALEHGPSDVQLRAAYHIGLTSLALATRARSSIAAPDLTDPESVKHTRILHARVERALEPALATARVSLGLVIQIGFTERTLLDDQVHRAMVRSAAAMLVMITEREIPTHLVQSRAKAAATPARSAPRGAETCGT